MEGWRDGGVEGRSLVPIHTKTSSSHFRCKFWKNTHIHVSHGWDLGAYTPTKGSHIFGTTFGKYTHALVTRLGNGSIHSQTSCSHLWDKFWKLSTYMCHTFNKWQHRLTKRLVTFVGQILENAQIHLSHCWDVGAYTHKPGGHIFGTFFLPLPHTSYIHSRDAEKE